MIKWNKGHFKLIKRVKIAHSFLQSGSDQFHVMILSLPMYFYKWLSKNFSKPTSKNGDMGHWKAAIDHYSEVCLFVISVCHQRFNIKAKSFTV